MEISARNKMKGKVTSVSKGAVNAEVTIQLPGGDEIVSIVTNSSVEKLKIEVGKEAYAIVKASNVMLGVD